MSTATNSATIERDHEREIANPIAARERGTLEVIGGFKVHPMASKFPLLVGKEFDEFVQAIACAGTLAPVETNEGLLIDGRNRVRAVEELRRRGIEIALPIVEWTPTNRETVELHIYLLNVHRRHLTDDQRAALAIEFLPFICDICQERQAATRFGQGRPVAQIASPPGEPVPAKRTNRDKDAASSVGRFAALCKIGLHKARQAAALAKGIEAGEISGEELVAVTTGVKRLRDVVPDKRASTKKKATAAEISLPDPSQILDAVPDMVDEPAPTEQEVRERWERLKRPFAISDHREVRRLLRQIIVEEQRRFDQ